MSTDITKETGKMSALKKSDGIKLVSYPKIIFMWPTWLIAIAGARLSVVLGDPAGSRTSS